MDDVTRSAEPEPGGDSTSGDSTPADATPAPDTSPLVPWAVDAPTAPGWEAVQQELAAPPAPAPSTPASRFLHAIAWLVGVAGVLFLGRVYAVLTSDEELTARQAGEVVGTIVAAILIGLGLRWAFVRAGRGRGLVSPWVLVVACAVLLANVGRAGQAGESPVASTPSSAPSSSAGSSPSASSRPIGAYLAVEAPYRMEGATADEAAEFKKSLGRPGMEMEVRRLTRSGSVEGFLLVMNAGALSTTGGLRAFETGIKTQPGVSTERATLAGREVVVADIPAQQVGFVAWIEGTTVLVVYGQDTDSASDMAEAVIAAYQ
jgi:hypothetical protein